MLDRTTQKNRIVFPLPHPVQKALERLNEKGYEAYCVGGCIRDYMMGITPHDFDITTSAMPEETAQCFADCRVIETGLKHGTITVILEDEQLEITTFRTDGVYSDNRHPDKVSFTRNLQDDLSRRDFTINAMAYNHSVGLCDPFGGEEHLESKTICCVGEPSRRFGEDALRILRALRFSSTLGFEIAPETSNAIFSKTPLLEKISRERIYVEFTKLLCGDDAQKILNHYRKVFEFVLPHISDYSDNSYKEATRNVVHCEKDHIIRYASLFLNIGDSPAKSGNIARTILRSLHGDNKTTDTVKDLITNYSDFDNINSSLDIKKFISRTSYDFVYLMIKLAKGIAAAGKNDTKSETLNNIYNTVNSLKQENACLFTKDLAVSGADLMDIGIVPGKNIGQILDFLLNEVIENRIRNEKNDLLVKAKEYRSNL